MSGQNDDGNVEAAAPGAEAENGGQAGGQGQGAQGGPAQVRAEGKEGVGKRQTGGTAFQGGEKAPKSPLLCPKRGQEEEERGG